MKNRRRLCMPLAVLLGCGVAGCATSTEDPSTEVFLATAADECDTTSQCKAMHGPSATDCLNSRSDQSVCMCGSDPCDNASPTPAPSPSADECNTTSQCKAMHGPSATDCLNSRSNQSVCMCGSDPCDNASPPPSPMPPTPAPPTPMPPAPPSNPNGCDYLIAYDADGNIYDADDIHATAMTLALIAEAGLQKCVVHFAYNTNLFGNTNQADLQHANVVSAIDRFGYNANVFFDVRGTRGAQHSAGKANFVSVMNQLGSNKRLVYILAGPMQVPYDFITAGPNNKEPFITVVSHSYWNDKFAVGSNMNTCWSRARCDCSALNNRCTASEARNTNYLEDLSVVLHHINDQNPPAFNSPVSSWQWLKQVDSDDWLFSAVATGTKKAGDASDSGMTYYVLSNGFPNGTSGTSKPSMSDVRRFFGQ